MDKKHQPSIKIISALIISSAILVTGCLSNEASSVNKNYINDSIEVLELLYEAQRYQSDEADLDVKMYNEIYTKKEKYKSAKDILENWTGDEIVLIEETSQAMQSGLDDLITVMELFTSDETSNSAEVFAQAQVLTDSGINKVSNGFTDFTLSEGLVLSRTDRREILDNMEIAFSELFEDFNSYVTNGGDPTEYITDPVSMPILITYMIYYGELSAAD
jgi:hypothetical protein